MKKICISFLSLLMLSGCNDDNKENTSLINRLSIKGEGISETIILNKNNMNYDFVAYENDSYFSILFDSKERKPIQYGHITLDQATKHGSLDTLLRVEDGINCPPLLKCTENTSYDLESKNGLNFIKVNFKDAPNFFYKPKSSESSSDEFIRIPVVINGQFSANAPMNWPIFQIQRFPEYSTEGSFNFDGKAYVVKYIGIPDFQYENGELKSETISILLKSSIDTLNLVVTKRFDISDQYDNVFVSIYNNDFSSSSLPISHDSWQDDGNLIYLDLINVGMVDQNSGEIKNLNTNVKIPRSNAKLTLNGHKLETTPVGSSFMARAANDQKFYYIGSMYNNKNSELLIIQELKGHISLKFLVDGIENSTCGDRNTICEGVTYDGQGKNFTFKNVKLGAESLNGTVYFAGVLK